jgi:hypothetical protein
LSRWRIGPFLLSGRLLLSRLRVGKRRQKERYG